MIPLDMIEKYAEFQPDATALLYVHSIDKETESLQQKSLTYKELNKIANQFAYYLASLGLKKGQFIGVRLTNSIEAVISLIAIWKLGAVYTPLNPLDPEERVNYLIEDSKISCLIASSTFLKKFHKNIQSIDISLLPQVTEGQKTQNYHRELLSSDKAYCIYTSGTTGKPKGVILDYAGLENWLPEQQRIFNLAIPGCILQIAPITFDPNLWNVLMALGSGSSLCVADKAILMDVDKLNLLFRLQKITGVTLTPSMLSLLKPTKEWSLRFAISTGEAFKLTSAIEAFFKNNIDLYNAYGPTEVTFGISTHKVTREDVLRGRVPIGTAIRNMKMELLDENLKPVEDGTPGEICISGVGVSKHGYSNKPELTKQKFIAGMYRTGDLGVYQEGNVYFLGRMDRQLKIEGKRIEAEEIEQTILEKFRQSIENVYVTTTETKEGIKRLVAYVVWKQDAKQESFDFHSQLTALPKYMIPSCFVSIEKFPLTSNGKIDTTALPPPTFQQYEQYNSPRNKIEQTLQTIWMELLDLQRKEYIGRNSNFYTMGGSSILLQVLKSKINEKFAIKYPMGNLLNDMTIAEQAETIETLQMKTMLQQNSSILFPGTSPRAIAIKSEPPVNKVSTSPNKQDESRSIYNNLLN